ncbi:hypothetical protein [Yersinia phage MHG19]|nr:hypothetical protein [Yersinia phage MHG19]
MGFKQDKWYRFRNCTAMCDFTNETPSINEKIVKRINLQPFKVLREFEGNVYKIELLNADFTTERLDVSDIDFTYSGCCTFASSESNYFEEIAEPQETNEDDYEVDLDPGKRHCVMVSSPIDTSGFCVVVRNISYDSALARVNEYLSNHPDGQAVIFSDAEVFTAKETVQIIKTEF